LIDNLSSILGLSSERCRTLLEQAGWNPEVVFLIWISLLMILVLK
jgi:hypothetical protein